MAVLDIANETAALLGERPITAVDDSTVFGEAFGDVYDSVRQQLLRAAVWTFAVVRTTLYATLDAVTDAYSALTTYDAGDLVTSSSIVYCSRVNGNIGNTPASSPTQWRAINPYQAAFWDAQTTYATGEVVLFNGSVYASIQAGSGQQPDTAGTYWVDTGKDEDTPAFGFDHQYAIPSGWIRNAPSTSDEAEEYAVRQREGSNFLTDDLQPLPLRYVQNVTDTDVMDPLFKGALAAAVAMRICERVTQSNAKKADAKQTFAFNISEAKRTNAIERGPFKTRTDDLITVRL